jgi:hypothetical protein
LVVASLIASFSGLAGEVSAAPIYGTAAPLIGSRTEDFGITTGGEYASDGTSFTVSWEIELLGDVFRYTYAFSGFESPDVSHFILDLTDDCVGGTADPNCVTDATVSLLEFNEFGTSPSNPGFPALASIVGVKFDALPDGTLEISFTSNRSPVYGDFYLKGGRESFAYNDGLTDHSSADVLDFIARPNGAGVVPEPGSLVLLGAGLLGLSSLRRKHR